MIKRYRKDYPGEFVVTNTIFKKGKKEYEREWIDNPIEFSHVSSKATCIAESEYISDALYNRIEKNNGGVLGKEKMQTYGVEYVWRKMIPTFTVCQVPADLEEMIKCRYTAKSIVYTKASQCIKYPGEFYLFPYSQSSTSQALALWLACFDGHTDVYFIGYDLTKADGELNQKMILSVANVIKTFPDVNFHQVSDFVSPDEWRNLINFTRASLPVYVSQCDV